MSSAEVDKEALELVKKHMFEGEMCYDLKSEDKYRKDLVSHHILRLAFCSSEDKRRQCVSGGGARGGGDTDACCSPAADRIADRPSCPSSPLPTSPLPLPAGSRTQRRPFFGRASSSSRPTKSLFL